MWEIFTEQALTTGQKIISRLNHRAAALVRHIVFNTKEIVILLCLSTIINGRL